jgi:hypothetical protein
VFSLQADAFPARNTRKCQPNFVTPQLAAPTLARVARAQNLE